MKWQQYKTKWSMKLIIAKSIVAKVVLLLYIVFIL